MKVCSACQGERVEMVHILKAGLPYCRACHHGARLTAVQTDYRV